MSNKKQLTIKHKTKEFTLTEGEGTFEFCFNGFGESPRIICANSSKWIELIYELIDNLEEAKIIKIDKVILS